tara:strand:+ start:2380 stop:3339 length:960 start_codon:yes stop_codon:yes gene_type:complete
MIIYPDYNDMKNPNILIFTGGVGPEREVSLSTGKALLDSLKKYFDVSLIDLKEERLPENLNPENSIVFPAIHGTFGEDGRLQQMLENEGIFYAGSDSKSSRLCMNKVMAKKVVDSCGVRTCSGIAFKDPNEINPKNLITELGSELVVKPIDQGSSVALYITSGQEELEEELSKMEKGNWMVEQRVFGREVTVGILGDDSLGIVEVIPLGGVYDFERKYSVGSTEYRYPAILDCDIESEVKSFALEAFKACECRDFARVDFIISEDGNPYFLEINTLPGLTETSLLPKSASCSGYDFDKLTTCLIEPVLERFSQNSLIAV